MIVLGNLEFPVADHALTLAGKKVLCRSPCSLQTNIYGQEEGKMQASGTIESNQQGSHSLVVRTCLRCEETSENVRTGA